MSIFWNRISKFSYSFISGIVVGLPIYITINDYFFCIARVEGLSMQPTLNPRDRKRTDVVFLNKWNIDSEHVSHGDIVAITSPKDQDVSFIKRIIGMEGDMVRTPRYKHDYAYVPKGHCWIEGDNSRSSLDSNSFGPISLGLIKGKATHIIWPPSRWTKLEQNIPPLRAPSYHDLKRNHKEKKINSFTTSDAKPNFKLSVIMDDDTIASMEESKIQVNSTPITSDDVVV